MKTQLLTHNLMTRAQLEDTWGSAGAEIDFGGVTEGQDLIVIGHMSNATLAQIQTLRASYPNTEILIFGPHVVGDTFKQVREAGATNQIARGEVVERLLKMLTRLTASEERQVL